MSSNDRTDDIHVDVETTPEDIEALGNSRASGQLTTDAFILFIDEMPKPDLRARRTAEPEDVPFRLE